MPVRPLVVAHRGACAHAPENTAAAFRAARAAGADGVELDVRRSADGVLVVHHDAELPGAGLVAASALDRLRAAKPDLVTLAEALLECAGMLVNVELKCLPWEPDADSPDHALVPAVLDVVNERGANVIVSSFDLGAVDACRRLSASVPTAWLTSRQSLGDAATRAAAHGHAWVHPDRGAMTNATEDDVAAAHAAGVLIDVWTVDAPEEIERLSAIGVDAIITNVPDVARAVLDAG